MIIVRFLFVILVCLIAPFLIPKRLDDVYNFKQMFIFIKGESFAISEIIKKLLKEIKK